MAGRNLKTFNNQRLQTSQLAATVPITNPSLSRSKDALNVRKLGGVSSPGIAKPAPVQGFLRNSFNDSTNNQGNLGSGYVIQYPAARVVPALRDRMAGGHPVITRVNRKPGS